MVVMTDNLTFPACYQLEIQPHLPRLQLMNEGQRQFGIIVLNPLGTTNLDLRKNLLEEALIWRIMIHILLNQVETTHALMWQHICR